MSGICNKANWSKSLTFAIMQAKAEAKAEAAEAVAKVTAEADLRIKQAEAKAAKAVVKANLEIAKRLLVMGLSPDAIKEATNLTDSQLAMLTKHQSS